MATRVTSHIRKRDMSALHVLHPLVVVLLASSSCGWHNLPTIPANRRVEYYLLHDDGAYKFGYDTGDGSSAVVSADPGNQVQGQYSYVDNQGKAHSLSYTSGDAGFVPHSVSGGAGVAATAKGGRLGSVAGNGVATPSSGSDIDPDYDANADGSYSFSIDTDSYKRTESADARGNVRGQYSYRSGAGGQSVSYIAGEDTGFVVTSSDGSPADPGSRVPGGIASDIQSGLNADGSYSFSYSTADQSRQETADAKNNVRGSFSFKAKDDGKVRKVDYEAGAATGFIARGSHLPVAPAVPGTSGYPQPGAPESAPDAGSYSNDESATGDASYSFSYDAGDHSRQESSDARGNVRGQFAFVAKDGIQRRVEYEAGAEKGFIAKGAHLPVAPSVDGSSATTGYSGAGEGGSSPIAGYSGAGASPSSYSAPQSDGSYSFSYSAADHNRQETADAQNNVRGSFSFRAKDDGKLRRVDYEAGAATGFIARGDHLPVAPKAGDTAASVGYSGAGDQSPGNAAVPSSYKSSGPSADGSYAFSYSAADHSREESADAQNNVRGSFSFRAKDDGKLRRVDYEAGAATGFLARGDHLPVAPSATSSGAAVDYSAPGAASLPSSSGPTSYSSSGPAADGSYSFAYSASDHSREESADAQNNVRGSFSFRAKDDGKLRRVDYEAGAATGFVARGDHLPVAPSAGISGAAIGYSTSGATSLSASSAPTSYSSSGPAADGSYSFAYSASDHSREESADAQNNVRGSFSFTAKDDGKLRRVDYEAGAATGFVARGDHLPVAPSVTSSGAVTGYSGAAESAVANTAASSSYSSSGPAADGSYSFSYSAPDHSREESGDAHNNVRGSYSFVAKDDGQRRRVDYVAGADTGFVAKGAHLPVPPALETPVVGVIPQPAVYSATAGTGSALTGDAAAVDGAYSFSYDAGDHSREESADARGNVRGSFSFVAKDDGVRRRVDYEAGAEKGFIAKGAHLPVAPSAGVAAPAGGYQAVVTSAAAATPNTEEDSGDASYSYNYETDSSSKQESSDAAGNVMGRFSFLGGDGRSRTVQYTSRGDEGFLATGDHLPKPVSATSVAGSTRAGSDAATVGAAVNKFHDLATSSFVVHKFLPPESTHKFGYIFDTKV